MSIKKRILRILHFILDFVFVAFVVAFAYIFVTVYKGDVPSVMGYHLLRVVSSSMSPEIKEGDCIICEPVDPFEIEIGDIITFYSDDPLILNYLNTHRVVGIENGKEGLEFDTKGDNNPREDAYTAKQGKLLGRYAGDILVGRVITKGFELLSDKKVYFALIILPILISFVASIVSMIKILLGLDITGSVITGLDDELLGINKQSQDNSEQKED